MNKEEMRKFKEKHGGYNPYELKIHQRGFWLGLCSILLIIDLLCFMGLAIYLVG